MGLTDISIGDLVTTTTAITALDDLSTVHVRFEVPERWAGRIAQGQAITATAQGLPGSEFAGRVTGVDNRVDETTRTLRLEAELANEGFALKSGMAIRVAMRFESDEHLVVPSLSVQWDRDGSFVWKVVDGAARRADVTILRRQSGIVTVQGELAAGETVVVEGIQRLREGAMVTQVNETPALVDEESPVGSGAPEVSGAASAAGTRS
jgi:RND family efflux transporter MFP subunit